MAKYEVFCDECGKEFVVQLFGKIKERKRKLETYRWICDECKRKQFEEKNRQAAEINKERGLPPLKGTEKRVDWAESIRSEVFKELDAYLSRSLKSERGERKVYVDKTKKILAKKDDAVFWIDRRHFYVDKWIDYALKDLLKREEKIVLFLNTESKRVLNVLFRQKLKDRLNSRYSIDSRYFEDFLYSAFQEDEGSVNEFSEDVEEASRAFLLLFALKDALVLFSLKDAIEGQHNEK